MGFSANLDVRGRAVLVCGGGPAAYGVISSLLESGAVITVVDPDPGTTVTDLADRDLIALRPRQVVPADLEAAVLVVPATGRSELDQSVLSLAREHRVPAVAADLGPRSAATPTTRGTVILVGGGPGDPGLLTVAGLEAIRSADVIICDRLAPLAALEHARSDAEIIDVAKIPRGAYTSQERINELLVEHGRAGKTVVRFKGGDNFVFGRGGEEWQACAAAGIPVRVIPGVSSAIAGPALAGIPLTHRQLTQGFTVVSGHLPPGDPGLEPRLVRARPGQHHAGDHDGRGHPGRDHRRAVRRRVAAGHAGCGRGRRRPGQPSRPYAAPWPTSLTAVVAPGSRPRRSR